LVCFSFVLFFCIIYAGGLNIYSDQSKHGIDAVANEIDVVLKFFHSGMKIQDFN
jgi:hypothetical protein